jgi:predicted metalloprotease with PDZ domain
MARLTVTLAPEPRGLAVTWRLDGIVFREGEALGQLAVSVAGAPTLPVDDLVVTARDDAGPVPLVTSVVEDDDGDDRCRWSVGRPTSGPVVVSYVAQAVAEEPRAATPPLELRRESGGLSGALKTFVVLPPGPEDLAFELRWDGSGVGDGWKAVCSLGEYDGRDGGPAGTGLELLGDTYLMAGDLAGRHHRDGELSVWWLTPPGIDVVAFAARLGTTYALMAEAFDAPAHPYRVFLRTHPHRGGNASAHPASFVMAVNPAEPLGEASLHETLAHELVHEWLHLDGPTEDVTWFVEGAADYYSLVLPFRAGLLDDEAFLRAVNDEARECYANPRRALGVREAQELFFSDFWAHRLPYTRGLFYLADLDARLRRATSDHHGVDDVVRAVLRRRRAGARVGLEGWCAEVEDLSGTAELPALDALVLRGTGRPGEGCFGPGFVQETVLVPVLDLGVDPSTLVTRRVRGLVPGGVAERAGLREGEVLDLPRYPELLRLDPGDVLQVGVVRDGEAVRIAVPLTGETAAVPHWRARREVSPPPSSPGP